MPAAVYILFGAALTVATAAGMGLLVMRWLGLKTDRIGELSLGFVLGAGCLSLAVFLLCSVHLAHKGVFLALGLFSLGLRRQSGQPANIGRWVWIAAAPFLVLYFFNAMAPEISPDGSAYHLGLVNEYYRDHGFSRITTNMYANLSQGIEMLFLFAWSFGRTSAAALVHFAFLLAVPLMMISYGQRFGLGRASAAGALFFFLTPVVGIDGTSAYNDAAVAAILFGLFYAIELFRADGNTRWLIPIGLLAGSGYAAKYTAFLAVPYACVRLGWKPRRWLIVAGCAAVMMAPWMLKNAILLGNPFSPFFNRWFPNPYVHLSFEEDYRRYMRNYVGIESLADVPREVTFGGEKLGGVVGPLFLLAPVAILAARDPIGRRLLAAAAVFGATYFTNIGTRFLIPCLPFLSLALAMVVSRVRGALVALVVIHALASWPWIMKRYVDPSAWRLASIPWRAALRIEPEEVYLGRFQNYLVARMIEDYVPAAARVLSPQQIAEAYTSRAILVGNQSGEGQIAMDLLWNPLMPEAQAHGRSEFRFEPKRLRRVRVVQTATGSDLWSIAEFRVLRGGRELPRANDWRLRASPNPWGVQMAFDNTPVTRWRSWQKLEDGMMIEVDFGREETVDTVRLEVSRDQYQVRLRLEGIDGSGAVMQLAGAPQEYDVAPLTGLRPAAVEELKSRGIGYVVIHESDFRSNDFYERQPAWNIELISQRGEGKLYRIK